jgi:hypothetical protein
MIPVITLAAKAFPFMRKRLVKACVCLGKVAWKYGLMNKGNGGVAANGYYLHCISRMFDLFALTYDEPKY